jgi:sensor histidine kinase YesM
MIKDKFLQLLFIPLLGVVIPYMSGVITYELYSSRELVGVFLYFVFVSFCIWQGCHWLHLKLRRSYAIDFNPFKKVGLICIYSTIYAGAISGILCLLWMKFSKEKFHGIPFLRFIIFSVMAALLFKLIYEVIYLSKERERDNLIVDQLDNELNRVEMKALRNELDPHFIFNSLNTLSYLIGKNDEKAQLFNNKLAHVYQYFLINKDKELIPLSQEMDFIENYIFLLQIRYDNTMNLNIDLNGSVTKEIRIIPCSVQLLIENAIKHTQFTSLHPLKISISMDKNYLNVENTIKKKTVNKDSTRIGLKNLNAQYQLVLKKSIIVERLEKKFIVKLPLYKEAIAV